MKKNILLTLGVISIFSITGIAVAATSSFSDQGSFSDWFKPSVEKLAYNDVIKGYPDGSFRANNQVSRAELAVILDRFASLLGKDLKSEATACTLEAKSGLQIILQDENGDPLKGATVTANLTSDSTQQSNFDEGDDGMYSGIWEGKGHYKFTVKKAGYADHVETIKLEKDVCHVIPEIRTITLFKKSVIN
ncbi:MAG: S-layer homology domain-containing protein [Candidatus Gracilibacteria bacterium]